LGALGSELALTGETCTVAGVLPSSSAFRSTPRVLYDVSPGEPTAWIIGVAVLLPVAAVAALLPGRRAVRVPPMQALRDG
jgi:hypothetical protein